MPDGGVILIEAVAIFPDTAEAMVELRVSDNGIGMTAETMSRAFDPFFTTTDKGLGGVGLAMVKGFAQEAGGGVKLASELGIGTTVMIRLPAARR
jgi:signal transduction histidine kinase